MKNKLSENKQTCTMNGCDRVFLAFMKLDYEGIFEESMMLFKHKTAAAKYIRKLKKIHGTLIKSYEIVPLHLH